MLAAAIVLSLGFWQQAGEGGVSDAAAATNVLLVVVDDLTRVLGCYGHDEVHSPRIDRLAERGVRFDRAYCQYPVCAPSRTSFLSGRRPEWTRVFDNDTTPRTHLPDAVFLPEHFRRNGYFTARVGKVFHIGRDDPQSWDVTEEGTPGNQVIYQPQEVSKLGLEGVVERSGVLTARAESRSFSILRSDAPEDELIDVRTAQRVAALLEQATREGKPFFVAAGLRRPHLPLILPRRFYMAYDPADLALPIQPREPSPLMPPTAPAPLTPEQHREALRLYYAAVSFADAQVGVLLDALDRLDLWSSTIVVLMGDHGYHLGDQGGYWGKGDLYEQAAGAPLIVVRPDGPTGVGCRRLVEFIDLYPTLVDLCGLPPAEGVQGRSLRPLLKEPTAPWDHPAYTVAASKDQIVGRAVSTQRYRYVAYDDERRGESLFDLETDPGELINRIADPELASERDRLRRLLREYVELNPLAGQ